MSNFYKFAGKSKETDDILIGFPIEYHGKTFIITEEDMNNHFYYNGTYKGKIHEVEASSITKQWITKDDIAKTSLSDIKDEVIVDCAILKRKYKCECGGYMHSKVVFPSNHYKFKYICDKCGKIEY